MWDFEADLSQTVLDKSSEDEKDDSQINQPKNLAISPYNNTHYRASQSQAIDWDSSDDDTFDARKVDSSKRDEITKNVGHEANTSFVTTGSRAPYKSSSKKLEFGKSSINHIDTEMLLESKKIISSSKDTVHLHKWEALDSLGYGDFRKEAENVMQECRNVAAKRRRQSTRLENLGIPEEELLRQQQELFAKAREQQLEQERQQQQQHTQVPNQIEAPSPTNSNTMPSESPS
jgi:hypothetical protein